MLTKPLKNILMLFIFICIGPVSVAQSNINIVHHSEGYGSSFRWVYDITQDDFGFMWFANHTGLRRYDGQKYRTYQNSETDPNSISSNTILKVAKGANDQIWALGIDAVFNKLDLKTDKIDRIEKFYRDNGLLPDFDFECKRIATLSNGDFILLLSHKDPVSLETTSSVWKFNPDKNGFDHVKDIPDHNNTISHFSETANGNIWLWGWGTGYHLLDLTTKEISFFPVPEDSLNTSTPVDKQRNFWYPTGNDGDFKLRSFKVPIEIAIHKINRLSVDNVGNIWFYHEAGQLYRFDIQTRQLDNLTDPVFDKSTKVQIMYHMFVDQNGVFWNGHFFGAIAFTKKTNEFRSFFTEPTSFRPKYDIGFNARDIVELSDEYLLVKRNDHSIHKLNIKTGQSTELKRNFNNRSGAELRPEFHSMILGSDGYLWTNQSDKIVQTNVETGQVQSFKIPTLGVPDPSDIDAFERYWPMLFEDNDSNLWLCKPEGLYIFNKATKTLESIKVSTLPQEVNAEFKFASFDPIYNVINAAYTHGIYQIDCSKKTATLIPVLSDQESYDTLITNILFWKNEFWLCSNKGLLRYNPTTRARNLYNRRDGLSSNIVFSILATEDHLWLGTQKGLNQFDPFSMRTVIYGEEHGLSVSSFNFWSKLRASTGDYYFGGINGIVGFSPDKFDHPKKSNSSFNLVSISRFNRKTNTDNAVQHLPYLPINELIVNASERSVSFRYVKATYNNYNPNYYSHYLEGLESEWINDGTRNEVSYTNLPPGNYTFHAKAGSATKDSEINEIEIPITIQQYWYLRWWAILLYIALTLMTISIIYRFLLNRRLEKQEALKVKEINAVKTKMYTNITHEFRTPLTVILGMNEAISDYTVDGDPKRIHQAGKMIDRNAHNLLNLINQMLELSKIESGQIAIHYQQSNIINYLKFRLETFHSFAAEKNIELEFKPDGDEIIMDFDVNKLSYIVANLVVNAIKFTPEKGKITVRSKRLTKNNNPFFELSVKDNGIGMESSSLANIFDRFYQVDDTTTRKGEGTGIGLSLVKELVTLLNGTIEVTSELGKGSEFTVNLPITNNAETTEITESAIIHEWVGKVFEEPFDYESYKNADQNIPLVLLTEDNADVLHYMAVSLKDSFRIVAARNGKEGIQKAIELIPDIIISDVMMPEKNGFELCETLKTDQRTSHIPIILLTGKADEDSKIEGLEHGADAYLSKPFNKKELAIRIKNLMALRDEIQKRYVGTDVSKSIQALPKIENEFLRKIRSIILENLEDEDFNVVELSKQAFLSRTQLHRKINALTGASTTVFIREIQMEKAKELLNEGKLNVSEVAFSIGFKTQAHFSRIFAETFGKSPSEFKKKAK